MRHKIALIVPAHAEVDVEIEKSICCPSGRYYVMGDQTKPMMTHLKMLYESEKEKNDWIRSYENVLQGLNYWREMALQAASSK